MKSWRESQQTVRYAHACAVAEPRAVFGRPLLRLVALGLAVITVLPALQAQSNYATPYTFTTLAGTPAIGSEDGTGSAARFYSPYGVAVDTAGNVYVADTFNHTIRKITSAGVVTTIAGMAFNWGSVDGTGSAARFNHPQGVAVDGTGNVYVADTSNHTIRRITPAGVVTILAGWGFHYGSADGTGGAARFNKPFGVAVDEASNLYVADRGNHTIRKITPAGVVTTLAGSAGFSGSTDGTGSAARFSSPTSVAVDGAGNVFVAENYSRIRKITSAGVVTTLADNAAGLLFPSGVAVDGAGNVYVANSVLVHTIQKITSAGVVTTFAGTVGSSGAADGTGSAARFATPVAVAVDGAGTVFVADTGNNTIRKITSAGVVTTFAGAALRGSADGTGGAAQFKYPSGVVVDGAGNIYVADTSNHTIRKIAPAGVVTTLAGSAGFSGSTDGTGSAARFNAPDGVAVDGAGNVYVADNGNNTIRKITSAGVVTTFAGTPGAAAWVDGTSGAARFGSPTGVAVDGAGTVYVAEYSNQTIRKITPAGVVTTLAGSPGVSGSLDGTGSAARFDHPQGVAVDGAGNVYVADTSNQTIRKITPAGVVTTLAGSAGSFGITDGTGSAAMFYAPYGVAVDGAGNVYVADDGSYTIRKITSTGVVTTIAGMAFNWGSADGMGSAARFNHPQSVAVDGGGAVYVADSNNSTIRKSVLALAIATQPLNQTITLGQNTSISVVASGSPPLSYQWRKAGVNLTDGGRISGATTAMLTITGVQSGDAGSYDVVVTSSAGAVTSAGAMLTLRGQGTAGSQLVAVGQGGTILTSPEGLNWTQRMAGTGVRLRAATASANLFVAVGEAGTVLTSPTGATWTVRGSVAA